MSILVNFALSSKRFSANIYKLLSLIIYNIFFLILFTYGYCCHIRTLYYYVLIKNTFQRAFPIVPSLKPLYGSIAVALSPRISYSLQRGSSMSNPLGELRPTPTVYSSVFLAGDFMLVAPADASRVYLDVDLAGVVQIQTGADVFFCRARRPRASKKCVAIIALWYSAIVGKKPQCPLFLCFAAHNSTTSHLFSSMGNGRFGITSSFFYNISSAVTGATLKISFSFIGYFFSSPTPRD